MNLSASEQTIARPEIVRIIAEEARDWNMPMPIIEFTDSSPSWAFCESNLIKLGTHCRRNDIRLVSVALHELAHLIAHALGVDKPKPGRVYRQAHGAEFKEIEALLLAKYGINSVFPSTRAAYASHYVYKGKKHKAY